MKVEKLEKNLDLLSDLFSILPKLSSSILQNLALAQAKATAIAWPMDTAAASGTNYYIYCPSSEC